MPIGTTELIIILVIVLLLFGAKRVPELGRSLGTGMREFKDSVTGKNRDEDERPELDAAAGAESAAAPEKVAADKSADPS